jgi:N-acetylglucosamine-6-phosphate deacetylase
MEETLASLEKLGWATQNVSSSHDGERARPLGLHLEGPFLSHARRGVHPPIHLQAPTVKIFKQMWDAAGGQIRMLTIAPELDGAIEVIKDAAGHGVLVSIGHTNADFDQTRAGLKAGARHATHTFNAMRRLEHRDPGVLGAILTNDAITADIIVDGLHVEPVIVDLFLRSKGVERAVLITDAISATGMPDGTYRLGSFEVQVRDGRCESYGKLAGSVLTLDRAVRNAMSFAKLTFQESVRLATLNPACVLGIEDRKGLLKPGADADIAVFSADGRVRQTIVGGQIHP